MTNVQFADAGLDRAVDGAAMAAFANAGQHARFDTNSNQ